MDIDVSQALIERRALAVLDFLDAGTWPARLEIYGGERPGAGEEAVSPLVVIGLLKPCGVITGGALVLASPPEQLVVETGVATWARLVAGDGAWALDCPVSDIAGAAPVRLSDVQLYAGGYTRLVSAVLS